MKLSPRCSCVTRDGSQCGRKVTDGSQPPVCHVHLLQAQGQTNSPLIPTDDEIDELKILKRLTRDGNPQVRLRAVDLLLSLRREEGCSMCKSRSASERENARLLEYASPGQCDRLRDVIERMKAIKTEILSYIAAGGTVHVEPEPPPTTILPQPLVSNEVQNYCTVESTSEEKEEHQLPRDQWAAVGLMTVPDAAVTHALGDEHARQILTGAITFAEAKAAHQRDIQTSNRMEASALTKFQKEQTNS